LCPSPSCFLYPLSPQIKDDRLAGVQSPIVQPDINHPPRRDTGLTGQTLYNDPSAKIWNLYLSQAEKFDKDHSESWLANTDGVLVFVRQTFSIDFHRPMYSQPTRSSDWSFLCGSGWLSSRQLSAVAAQSNRSHKSAACPNLPAIVCPPEWVILLGALYPSQSILLPTHSIRRACECLLVHQSHHEHCVRNVGDSHATMDQEVRAGCG
jgi:hypothetical protein